VEALFQQVRHHGMQLVGGAGAAGFALHIEELSVHQLGPVIWSARTWYATIRYDDRFMLVPR
jgi:hypothetical protein